MSNPAQPSSIGSAGGLSNIMSNSTQHGWDLSFGQVEAALGTLCDIQPSRRSMLQSRLKNLFKVGFLPHVAAGRGKAARYGAGEIFQLAFAIELMQFELGPHGIIDAMKRLDAMVVAAAAEAGAFLSQKMQPLSVNQHLYLSFDPSGLEALSRDWGSAPKPTERIYRGEQPESDRAARRLAIINITRLSIDLADALASHDLCEEERFGELIHDWARSRGADD